MNAFARRITAAVVFPFILCGYLSGCQKRDELAAEPAPAQVPAPELIDEVPAAVPDQPIYAEAKSRKTELDGSEVD